MPLVVLSKQEEEFTPLPAPVQVTEPPLERQETRSFLVHRLPVGQREPAAKLVVNGRERPISRSSMYILDMITGSELINSS